MEKSDYELLNGDSDDFGELYQRYCKGIEQSLWRYKLVGNRSDINDILQLVWSRVHQKRTMYNPKWKFSTWLTRLAFNVAVNFYRDQQRTALITNDNSHLDTFVDHREYRDPVITTETQESVREAVNNLPTNAREAIEAIYLRQTDTCKGRHSAGYKRGRRRLKASLQGLQRELRTA